LQKKAAEAALLNAQAVIAEQRPWIIIFIKEVNPGIFTFAATNQGKTPAKIISYQAEKTFVDKPDNLPIPPHYGLLIIPPVRLLVPGGPKPDGSELDLMLPYDTQNIMTSDPQRGAAITRGEQVFVFYFRVVYRDFVTRDDPQMPNYETRMCFWYAPKITAPRIGGPDEYNEHT
jgi:hypothetical protein